MAGKEFEQDVFTMIRSTLRRLGHKNVSVFSGFKFHIHQKERELDFLIIHDELKFIIHVEAKTSLDDTIRSPKTTISKSKSNDDRDSGPPLKRRKGSTVTEPLPKKKTPKKSPRDKAKEQLDVGLEYFRSVCFDKDWHYCKVPATRSESLARNKPCNNCQPFFITDEKTIEELLGFLRNWNKGDRPNNSFISHYQKWLDSSEAWFKIFLYT